MDITDCKFLTELQLVKADKRGISWRVIHLKFISRRYVKMKLIWISVPTLVISTVDLTNEWDDSRCARI
jgi:hypothetical protein